MPTTDVNAFTNFLSKINLSTILFASVSAVICLITIKYLMKFFKKLLSKTPVDPSFKSILLSIIKFVLYFIAATIIADILGLPPTSLITVIGTLGLAFSLAMQDSLSNIAGGILLIYTTPFKIGDYIEACGVNGTVQKVGLIHTSLKTIDNKKIYVPNSSISKDKIINYSSEAQRQVEIVFPTSYSSDTQKAKNIIEKTILSCPYVDTKRDIFIRVWALSLNSVDIIARCWVGSDNFIEARCYLLENTKQGFEENKITIPFNQLDVHINQR